MIEGRKFRKNGRWSQEESEEGRTESWKENKGKEFRKEGGNKLRNSRRK